MTTKKVVIIARRGTEFFYSLHLQKKYYSAYCTACGWVGGLNNWQQHAVKHQTAVLGNKAGMDAEFVYFTPRITDMPQDELEEEEEEKEEVEEEEEEEDKNEEDGEEKSGGEDVEAEATEEVEEEEAAMEEGAAMDTTVEGEGKGRLAVEAEETVVEDRNNELEESEEETVAEQPEKKESGNQKKKKEAAEGQARRVTRSRAAANNNNKRTLPLASGRTSKLKRKRSPTKTA